jgi:hypothetical protein
LWHTSYGGGFGWLKRSGFVPQVADIKDLDADKMSRWKAALYIDPGLIGEREAKILTDYVEGGGMLIVSGWPSECDLEGKSTATHRKWSEMFPGRFMLNYRRGTKLSFFIDKRRFNLRSYAPVGVWEVPDKDSELFLRAPSGGWCGCRRKIGKGNFIFFTSDLSRVINTSNLYKLKEDDLENRRVLMKMMMSWIDVAPVLDWTPSRVEVCARRAPGSRLFLFCTNDGEAATAVIRPALPDRLGLDMPGDYRIHRVYQDTDLPVMSQRSIFSDGVKLPLKKQESETLFIEPVG